VEEQGAATQEISRNVQQAAHGTQQVSANVADVERGATDTGSASSQVLGRARAIGRLQPPQAGGLEISGCGARRVSRGGLMPPAASGRACLSRM